MMANCPVSEPVNEELCFGVELLNLYPSWYIHPSLKNLIYLAGSHIQPFITSHTVKNGIEQLLRNEVNGDKQMNTERDTLKEYFVKGKGILNLKVSPEVPIWLLRYFVSRLPTPIFTSRFNKYYWFHFARVHSERFSQSVNRKQSNKALEDIVVFDIADLPSRNFVLLFELFDLMRLCSCHKCTGEIDENSALILAQYFAKSLFLSPCVPNFVYKRDQKYVWFVLYLIYFWPVLRQKIHALIADSIHKKIFARNSISESSSKEQSIESGPESAFLDLSETFSGKSSTTSVEITSPTISKSSSEENLSEYNHVSEKRESYLEFASSYLKKYPSFLVSKSTQTSPVQEYPKINQSMKFESFRSTKVEKLKEDCQHKNDIYVRQKSTSYSRNVQVISSRSRTHNKVAKYRNCKMSNKDVEKMINNIGKKLSNLTINNNEKQSSMKINCEKILTVKKSQIIDEIYNKINSTNSSDSDDFNFSSNSEAPLTSSKKKTKNYGYFKNVTSKFVFFRNLNCRKEVVTKYEDLSSDDEKD